MAGRWRITLHFTKEQAERTLSRYWGEDWLALHAEVVRLTAQRDFAVDDQERHVKNAVVFLERAEAAESALASLRQAEPGKLREAVEDLPMQFAYRLHDPPRLYTGGLSALEDAFDLLGWSDPYPTPDMGCEQPGCGKHATCGTPTAGGYKRSCGEHYRAEQERQHLYPDPPEEP